ncbi:hypothetical protein M3Y98_01043200 [Aphelenchoides besseyi]|nr:hypothetical protein M3Y98_01043200 [Aphelenchoides besseyi]KAI6209855.1 hypothetical protein M3Y96_00265300 [Aphelenchoides besseyi]
MRLFTLLFILFEGTAVATNHPICKYYEEFEEQHRCGSNGYFLAFGQKYCNKFLDSESEFNRIGRNFVDCTAKCLVKRLESYLEIQSQLTCPTITDKAFEMHVDCYLECNFCAAWCTNKRTLFKIYDVRDFQTSRAIRTVFEVLHKCGGIVKLHIQHV